MHIQNDSDLTDNTDINLSEIGNKINIEHLNMLISIDWYNLLGYNDINKAYETFNITINQLVSLSSYNVTGASKKHKNFTLPK